MHTNAIIYFRWFVVLVFAARLSNAQDSLPRIKLRLFDLQFGLGLAGESAPQVNQNNIAGYTSHKKVVSSEFMEGYNDSLGGVFAWAHRHDIGEPEFALNALFQFQNTRSKLLRRIKLRTNLNYFQSTLFRYELGFKRLVKTDTFYYTDPAYPPLIEKYYDEGEIEYRYSSRRLFLGVGANFDIIQHRYIIVYAGVQYSFGIGSGRFGVYKRDNHVTVNEYYKEGANYTSRYFFPIGILLRARTDSKKNLNFFAEIKPGYYLLKTKDGAKAKGALTSINVGVRLSLQPHK